MKVVVNSLVIKKVILVMMAMRFPNLHATELLDLAMFWVNALGNEIDALQRRVFRKKQADGLCAFSI